MIHTMVSMSKLIYTSPDNVEEWAVFCVDNPVGIAFSNELQTYFGIRHKDQMTKMQKNFCSEL